MDWISLLALLLSAISLGMSWMTKRADDRRLFLSQLRAALARLEKEALKHLFIPGVSGAEREVRSLHKDALYLVDRVKAEDVRDAAIAVLEQCLKVIDLRKREPPMEEKDRLTSTIENAMKEADRVIGARMDKRFAFGLVSRSKNP